MTIPTTSGEMTAYAVIMVLAGLLLGLRLRRHRAPPPLEVEDTKYRRAQTFLDACTFSMITRVSINLDAYGVGKVIVDSVESQDKSGYNFVLTTAGGQKHSVIIS